MPTVGTDVSSTWLLFCASDANEPTCNVDSKRMNYLTTGYLMMKSFWLGVLATCLFKLHYPRVILEKSEYFSKRTWSISFSRIRCSNSFRDCSSC